MTQENHSSKSEDQDNKEIEELKKKAENLQKMLNLTLDHEKNLGKLPTGNERFGKYEVT